MRFFLIFLLLPFLAACSSNVPSNGNTPILKLSRQFTQEIESLTGSLSVYDSTAKPLHFVSLSFVDDGTGETIVTSPTFSLRKGTVYRFVLAFYWNAVPIAYVDTTQRTSNGDTSTIKYSEELITYEDSKSIPTADVEILLQDISSGVIPQLDLDQDGFSNFIELRAGSLVDDPSSIPEGPKATNFTADILNNGELVIQSSLQDGHGIFDVILEFPGNEYLKLILQENLTGNEGEQERVYNARLNLSQVPEGNLEFILKARNAINLFSEFSEKVFIPSDGANNGPIIDFESLSEGASIGDIMTLSVRAYDPDGVQSLELIEPNTLADSLDNISSAPDRYIAEWDTKTLPDGLLTLQFQAKDLLKNVSIQSIQIIVVNGNDASGPRINLHVYEDADSDAEIHYDDNQTVFGRIGFRATATDPSNVNSFILDNAGTFNDILVITDSNSNTSYSGTLDTTSLEDGSQIFLQFKASDDLGNQRTRTFSMTVGNHPIIHNYIASTNNASLVLDSGIPTLFVRDFGDITFEWDTSIANEVQINRLDGEIIHSSLNTSGAISIPIQESGTYRLQATRTTNVEDYSISHDLAIKLDSDGDQVFNEDDNCPAHANHDQADFDGDGMGNVCDEDVDGDELLNLNDNCPIHFNPDQADLDEDRVGNLCDEDTDGDEIRDDNDNCPLIGNSLQTDEDRDGVGLACDCNDMFAQAYPGREEKFDGVDNNCNGLVDEGIFQEIIAGTEHTCGLKHVGSLFCWGNNNNGQSESPIEHNNFIQITLGRYHTCGLLEENRSIICWGSSEYGQLVTPEGRYIQTSAGLYHTCGIREDNGSLACWGRNDDGQAAPPQGSFLQVSSGNRHSCALRIENGSISCWGDDDHGQSSPPAENQNFIEVTAADTHTCALKADGLVVCWGNNGLGQTSAPPSRFLTISASGVSTCGLRASDNFIECWGWGYFEPLGIILEIPSGPFTKVSSGLLYFCGLRDNGVAACWGQLNSYGQSVPPTGRFIQLSSNQEHSCGLRLDQSVSCWGEGDQAKPTEDTFVQISSGKNHSCGIRADNSTVVCWGSNAHGKSTPPDDNAFIQIDTGEDHTCALNSNQSIHCWGGNDFGQATPPLDNNHFVQLSLGFDHSCALRDNGATECWGRDNRGQSTGPLENNDFIQISSGANHTCGLKDDGSVLCWGSNDDGQIAPLDDADIFTQVSAGISHSCGLRDDRSIVCWGNNESGQTMPPSGSFTNISAGGQHTCAIRADRTVSCWGRIYYEAE
jgi:alpha-tubulin suppressor-like RCC1 family protein